MAESGTPRPAQRLLAAALVREAEAQRALLAGDDPAAREGFAAVSELYRRSWEAAPPASYGRLIGMVKAAILAGDPDDAAAYALAALGEGAASPAAAYARALACLVTGDDEAAVRAAD